MLDLESTRWAAEEFDGFALGHRWRDSRWLSMAARAASNPSGQISRCFAAPAERQAAYKLLESGSVRPVQVVRSAAQAALRRATATPYIVAPLDQCTLTLSASNAAKAFGRVGMSALHCFGAESMHAIALSASGVPLGLLAQVMWTRREPPRDRATDTRYLSVAEKETRYWIEVAHLAYDAWRASGTCAPLWFQLDAGGDAREVLERLFALEDAWVTVRCRRDRKLSWPDDGFLSETLGPLPVIGHMKVKVGRKAGRIPRTAVLELRSTPVTLRLKHPWTKKLTPLTCYAVSATEVGTCPEREEPIRWVLLTTHPAMGFAAASEVVKAYALRWRVEEVHRTWKSGCQVESSGLSFGAFQPWAALLLCVAVRTERLKRLSRERPELPASDEFTGDELRALCLLSRRAKARPDSKTPVTLGEAMLWVAELGGYMGPTPSRGPPGSLVIQRGLDTLAHYADAIRLMRDSAK